MEQKQWSKLPLGAITAKGWLLAQLTAQRDGLTGALEEIWEDVGPNSGWLGGSGESWERGPYYCDGMVPLAWLLGDKNLLQKAEKWVEWSLQSQREDGFFGPASNDDWWPRMVMLKVLVQQYEAAGDDRILTLMKRYFAYQLQKLPEQPLRDWGKFRVAENLYAVLWLYERVPDDSLLELAKLLLKQGYDWSAFFADLPYKGSIRAYMDWQQVQTAKLEVDLRTEEFPDYMPSHIVNVAMGLKYPALRYRITGEQQQLESLQAGLQSLYQYHGVANGLFTGDEHLSGNSPEQGSELCAVVEMMFSLELIAEITGESGWLDLLERVAYNALPATIDKQFRTHQYLQQVNQISCTIAPRNWYNNEEDSNIFGLQPNFGCCTANMHQGWPKLVQSLWMGTPQGMAAMAYAPCEMSCTLPNHHVVSWREDTCYPFKNSVCLTLSASAKEQFELRLRLPEWSEGYGLLVNGAPWSAEQVPGWLVLNRSWQNGDQVELHLSAPVRQSHWYANSVALESGALVYALDLGGHKSCVADRPSRFGDWELLPQREWNYLLLPDTATRQTKPIATPEANLFETPEQLDYLEVEAERAAAWTQVRNSAAPPPHSPMEAAGEGCKLTLLPYGATMLRITQFPWRHITK